MANHEEPEVRKVRIGSRTIPYWEAGAAYQPYAAGYFASAAMMAWAFQPTTGFEGPHDLGGGQGPGADFGGGDWGGFDGGGGGQN